MTARRAAGLAAAGATVALAACTSGPSPDPVARDFLAAWARGDAAAAGALTDAPTAASAALAAARAALGVTATSLRLATVSGSGASTRAAYTARLTLRGLGEWAYDGRLAMHEAGGRWRVHWEPADLHPGLAAGQRLGRTRTLPERGALLDGAGSPLLRPTEVVNVSVLPSAVPDLVALLATLQRVLGVSSARLGGELAKAKPELLLPVISLRRADYDAVRAEIHDLPGLRFPTEVRQLAPTATWGRALLGRVGPATADALAEAGPAFLAGDDVGLSGLQAAFQRRLAGTASGTVVARDTTGAVVSTLATLPGTPGSPVRTTLDPRVQDAAEQALGARATPAALVAVRPSDGAVLAVANRPGESAYDRALAGRYPPGSTFKIVTAAALLGAGLRPGDPVPCPPSVTVAGKSFRNFEGEAAGALPFARDFAISCNTAFIGATRARLSVADLAAAARLFGIGAGWGLPLTAYAGGMPTPSDAVELAADAIGQGRVTVSPLGMALVAAAVQSGTWRAPVLVSDPASPPGAAPSPLPAAPELRVLMRSVVTSGTAAPAFRSYAGAPVSGKTGTAEFGAGSPPRTHAWFVGFRGDLAVSVVVEGGGVGGAVAAPIAARFFGRL